MDKDTRTSMKKAPCTRGLSAFKKGCPGQSWDGENGCPLWREDLITVPEGNGTKEVVRAQCVDLWQYDFMWWNHARMSGTQQAVEMFRNNMSVAGSPKPDPAMVRILEAIEKGQKGNEMLTPLKELTLDG